MRRTARLLVLIGLAAVCCGPEEKVEGEWNADSICDEPGLEWACEEAEEAAE